MVELKRAGFWTSSFLYIVGTALLRLVPVLILPIIARHLAPAEMGILELGLGYFLLFQTIATLSLEAAVGRFFFDDPQIPNRATVLGNALAAIFVCSLVIGASLVIAAAPLASLLLDDADYAPVMQILGVSTFLAALFNLAITVIRFLSQIRLFFVVCIGFSAISFSLIFWLVVGMQWGVEGYLLGQMGSYLLVTPAIYVFLMRGGLFNGVIDRRALRILVGYSIPIMPAILFVWFNVYGIRVVSLDWLGVAEVGLLAVAMRLASVIKLGEEGLKMIWSPYVFRSLRDDNHREEIAKKFLAIAAMTFALGAITQLIGLEIYNLILPSSYETGFKYFCIFVSTFCLSAMIQLLLIGPSIVKRTWINSLVIGTGSASSLGMLFVLSPIVGTWAPPLAMIVGALTMVIGSWIATERLYPIGFPRMAFAGLITALIAVTAVSINAADLMLLRYGLAVLILATCLLWLRRSGILREGGIG